MKSLPGEGLAARPLHFIWIADCSGSMNADGKIQALNTAIREAIPYMQAVAEENQNAEVFVRAIKFSDSAQWHVSQPTPVKDFRWTDLTANGVTAMGKALSMVADALKSPPMPARGLPPVLVLISDGQPTDDFAAGLKALMAEPWGVKAVRMTIAIGADADMEVLQKFIGLAEIKPLRADNPEALTWCIKFVSTAVLKSAAAGKVPIPVVPAPDPGTPGTDDVW